MIAATDILALPPLPERASRSLVIIKQVAKVYFAGREIDINHVPFGYRTVAIGKKVWVSPLEREVLTNTPAFRLVVLEEQ